MPRNSYIVAEKQDSPPLAPQPPVPPPPPRVEGEVLWVQGEREGEEEAGLGLSYPHLLYLKNENH